MVGLWLVAAAAALSSAPAAPCAPPGALTPKVTASRTTPGTALVLLGARACGGHAGLWFEHGPTTAYGARTPEGRDLAVEVDALPFDREYHFRVLLRTRDGQVLVSEDVAFTVRPGPLRPTSAIRWRLRGEPGRAGTRFRSIAVARPPRGATVQLSTCLRGPTDCRVLDRRLARRSVETLTRGLLLRRPRVLEVAVLLPGTLNTIFTTLAPRARGLPVVQQTCPLFGGTTRGERRECLNIRFASRGARLVRLAVTGALHGTTVEILCRGPGCPRRTERRLLTLPADRAATRLRDLSLSAYRRMRPGAVVDVFVSRPGSYGLHRSVRVSRRRVTATGYRCLAPGTARRRATCPVTPGVTVLPRP